MRTLSDKSIEKLELPAVLELLAGQAASADGKERCRAIRPETDLDEVRLLQAQTSAACHLITLKARPPCPALGTSATPCSGPTGAAASPPGSC